MLIFPFSIKKEKLLLLLPLPMDAHTDRVPGSAPVT
jgi:hypothetical protein